MTITDLKVSRLNYAGAAYEAVARGEIDPDEAEEFFEYLEIHGAIEALDEGSPVILIDTGA